MENLKLAHKNARKGKGWYKEVQWVNEHEEECLQHIQDLLKTHTYKTSKYIKFHRIENGKMRTIYKLPYYPDRIVHWAIMQQIEPYITRTFIYDTYSSIPKRGTHLVARKIQKILHSDTENCKYCLKMDIRHFYQNINHSILKQKYRKIFKDKELLYIINEVIDSINTAEEQDLISFYGNNPIDIETGIPIGNYLSQYSGNLYLSDLDHYIKEELRIKYYFRYMDDIVILYNNKGELHTIQKQIEQYLSNIRLLLKPNWQIFPVAQRGIDFVGYRFYPNKTLLRKSTLKRIKRKMQKICIKAHFDTFTYSDFCTINSYLGLLKSCNYTGIYDKYFKDVMLYCKQYYTPTI